MTERHKWYKEIQAWSEGAEIQSKSIDGEWIDIDVDSEWESDEFNFRIKPQPKEKKYLYVYHKNGFPFDISHVDISHVEWLSYQGYEYLGKIEVQND